MKEKKKNFQFSSFHHGALSLFTFVILFLFLVFVRTCEIVKSLKRNSEFLIIVSRFGCASACAGEFNIFDSKEINKQAKTDKREKKKQL